MQSNSPEDRAESSVAVYLVVAHHYDMSQVQGVYGTREAAEKAVEMSNDSYRYEVVEKQVKEEPESHDPYF